MSNKPVQKILFGSPGTGKSHRVENELIPKPFPNGLGITKTENIIKTVFHPEYTYGDFMGKLMPISKGGKVEYNYYSGHFLKALGQAYKNILLSNFSSEATTDVANSHIPQNVALVIDEINRGNSAAIFGTVFQLLDREQDKTKDYGWSNYTIDISDLEFQKLLEIIGLVYKEDKTSSGKNKSVTEWGYAFTGFKYPNHKNPTKELEEWLPLLKIGNNQIRIPNNLHFIATMNTSDNSIYFMDNAFKRRWDWQFVDIDEDKNVQVLQTRNVIIEGLEPIKWIGFVNKLNGFFIDNHKVIRKIEDKQIGYFFINESEITVDHIKSKLMFFVWDSVFHSDKKPLAELLNITDLKNLVTFGQFTKSENVIKFIQNINSR